MSEAPRQRIPGANAIIRRLKAEEKKLAARRDALRDIEADAAALGECAENALDSLTVAIDSLSEYV